MYVATLHSYVTEFATGFAKRGLIHASIENLDACIRPPFANSVTYVGIPVQN